MVDDWAVLTVVSWAAPWAAWTVVNLAAEKVEKMAVWKAASKVASWADRKVDRMAGNLVGQTV